MTLGHAVISNGCAECGNQYAGDDAFYWSTNYNGPICETCGLDAIKNNNEQQAKKCEGGLHSTCISCGKCHWHDCPEQRPCCEAAS